MDFQGHLSVDAAFRVWYEQNLYDIGKTSQESPSAQRAPALVFHIWDPYKVMDPVQPGPPSFKRADDMKEVDVEGLGGGSQRSLQKNSLPALKTRIKDTIAPILRLGTSSLEDLALSVDPQIFAPKDALRGEKRKLEREVLLADKPRSSELSSQLLKDRKKALRVKLSSKAAPEISIGEQISHLFELKCEALRMATWKRLNELGSSQSFLINKQSVQVIFEPVNTRDCFGFTFQKQIPGNTLESFFCQLTLTEGVLEVKSFNNAPFLNQVITYFALSLGVDELDVQWMTFESWLSLKDQMKADREMSYPQKLVTLLNMIFQVNHCRPSVSWIDMDAQAVASTGEPRALKVTYSFDPFNFQIIKKNPQQLGLASNSQMLKLCFWDGETASEPFLVLHFLLDRPLMEIYYLARSDHFSGSESLGLALDVQEMLGASALLFDDAKIYDSTHTKAATLLFWRSLGKDHVGFYERRGFKLIDLSFKMHHRIWVTHVDQSAKKFEEARLRLSDASFGEFVSIAGKSAHVCLEKAANILQISFEACAALKVQKVADTILGALQKNHAEQLDSVLADIAFFEKKMSVGVTKRREDPRLESIRQIYIDMLGGRFFVRPGYREGTWPAPWSFSQVI